MSFENPQPIEKISAPEAAEALIGLNSIFSSLSRDQEPVIAAQARADMLIVLIEKSILTKKARLTYLQDAENRSVSEYVRSKAKEAIARLG